MTTVGFSAAFFVLLLLPLFATVMVTLNYRSERRLRKTLNAKDELIKAQRENIVLQEQTEHQLRQQIASHEDLLALETRTKDSQIAQLHSAIEVLTGRLA